MIVANCPVCKNPDNTLFYSKEKDLVRENFSFNILRCNNCSHLFLFPLPSSKESDSIYGEERRIFLGNLEKTNKKIKKWKGSWRRFVLREYLGYKKAPSRNILKYLCAWFLSRFTSLNLLPFHREGRILDVGCNNGLYLHLLKNLGWQVWGIEIDGNACKLAKELDLDVSSGDLEKAGFSESFFDVVRFNQVLEHTPDPKKTINEAKRILKKGGKIYISVPNARSFVSFLFKEMWLGTDHVQGFSSSSMRYLCRNLGLKIKSMRFTSSRDLFLKGINHFFNARGKGISLENGFTRYVIASPFIFVLNILHLSDTISIEAEK